ncbi:hypothetical protein GZL_05421 [Streptomyces sp. 769]|nr:hypothetical protein GZL_05421 [Streptomyces sp. 769]
MHRQRAQSGALAADQEDRFSHCVLCVRFSAPQHSGAAIVVDCGPAAARATLTGLVCFLLGSAGRRTSVGRWCVGLLRWDAGTKRDGVGLGDGVTGGIADCRTYGTRDRLSVRSVCRATVG